MTVIYELESNDISKILAKYFGTDPKNVKVMVGTHYLYDDDHGSYQVARAEVKFDTELEIDETE